MRQDIMLFLGTSSPAPWLKLMSAQPSLGEGAGKVPLYRKFTWRALRLLADWRRWLVPTGIRVH
jgi:hypothetical protein